MEIREALEAAIDAEESAQEPDVVSTPEAPPETAPEAPPAPEAPEAPTTPEKPETAPEKPPETPPAKPDTPPPPGPEHRVDRPPASWKKEAKGEWAALPLHVRQEVYRREGEVNRVLRETADARQTTEQFNKTVQPYMQRIQAHGISPLQAVDELFQADHVLSSGTGSQKAQMLAKLVSDYGVDIKDLDAALSESMAKKQTPQSFDPEYVNRLVQQQLQQALAPIYQERQQKEQQSQQEAAQSIEQMALDPAYPYFDDVRQEMADLIEVAARRGVVLSLKDAYTRAVMIDPSVSEQQSRQTGMAQANQQHLQAQRAKVAGSSVTGAPAGGGAQAFVGDGSLRGAIEAAFSNNRV